MSAFSDRAIVLRRTLERRENSTLVGRIRKQPLRIEDCSSQFATDAFHITIKRHALTIFHGNVSGTRLVNHEKPHLVYLLEFRCVGGQVVHKIGVTHYARSRVRQFQMMCPPVGTLHVVGLCEMPKTGKHGASKWEGYFSSFCEEFHIRGEWFCFPDCNGGSQIVAPDDTVLIDIKKS